MAGWTQRAPKCFHQMLGHAMVITNQSGTLGQVFKNLHHGTYNSVIGCLLEKTPFDMNSTFLDDVVSELETSRNLSIVLAAVWVITYHFSTLTKSPLIIGQYAQTEDRHYEHEDLVMEISKRTSNMLIKTFLMEADNVFDMDYEYYDLIGNAHGDEYIYRLQVKKDTALWFLDSLESFKRLEADLRNERWNYQRNGFFCIIYTGRESNSLDNIKKIFRKLLSLYVTNVNVLITFGKTVYCYSYFPFSPRRCHDPEPRLLGVFGPDTGYNFNRPYFFDKKLLNMWQCSLKVTTWTVPPFILVERDFRTGKFLRLGGIEGSLITVLSQRMNFSVTLAPPPINERGYYYRNGTATGATKMLLDGQTDIFINCLMYEQLRAKIFQPAYIYMNIPISVAIPQGKRMTSFERLYRPFKYIIWCCLCSSVLGGIAVIYGLKLFCKSKVQAFVFGQGNRTPFTFLWNGFCGVSILGRLPRRNFARFLLTSWIIYTFIMRTAYIGQLFYILQDSRAATTIRTVDEAIAKNFTFFTFPTMTNTILASTKFSTDLKYIDSRENTVANLFNRLHDENAQFVVTVLDHIIHVHNQKLENRYKQVNFLPRPLYVTPITFYMRKHSYLAYEMDELILRILSAGLIYKFESTYLNQRRFGESHKPEHISLWIIRGVFFIYFALVCLCFLVFLFEMWSKRSPLTRKAIDFFNA